MEIQRVGARTLKVTMETDTGAYGTSTNGPPEDYRDCTGPWRKLDGLSENQDPYLRISLAAHW